MSVRDQRRLVFDEEAIRASLRCRSKAALRLRLPTAPDDRVTLLPLEQCVELLHDPSPGMTRPQLHRLSASQLGALLIAYCMHAGIPVPRNCEKGIVVRAADVALTFQKTIEA